MFFFFGGGGYRDGFMGSAVVIFELENWMSRLAGCIGTRLLNELSISGSATTASAVASAASGTTTGRLSKYLPVEKLYRCEWYSPIQ